MILPRKCFNFTRLRFNLSHIFAESRTLHVLRTSVHCVILIGLNPHALDQSQYLKIEFTNDHLVGNYRHVYD